MARIQPPQRERWFWSVNAIANPVFKVTLIHREDHSELQTPSTSSSPMLSWHRISV